MSNNKTKKTGSMKMKPGSKLVSEVKERAIKAVEKSHLLQNTLSIISDMRSQARSIRNDANEEVHKLLDVLQHSYHDLEGQARKAQGKAKTQAKEGVHHLLSKWEEKKESLPKKFVSEMDQLIARLGFAKKPAAKKNTATKGKGQPSAKAKAKANTPVRAPSKPKKLVIRKVQSGSDNASS